MFFFYLFFRQYSLYVFCFSAEREKELAEKNLEQRRAKLTQLLAREQELFDEEMKVGTTCK